MVRLAVSYAAQPGSPLVMKFHPHLVGLVGDGLGGRVADQGTDLVAGEVSNTKGISAAWHAPSRWLASGPG